VPEPTRGRRRLPPWSRLAALIFAAAALVSAIGSARVVVPQLDAWRKTYSEYEPERRELEVLHSLGFEPETWERLGREFREGDRYYVAATVPYEHEIRNYAGYALLPAVRATDIESANVVVYWQLEPPVGQRCEDVGQEVCVLRKPS
jgi:hypothetical protein